MATRLSWAIVAGASLAPTALHAADRDIYIDLPAATLAQSIAALSTQTGVSIGTEGGLPYLRTPDVRGRMSVARALDKLLSGTAWRARRVSPTAYRIVARPHYKPPPHYIVPDYPYPAPIADVVVTARKIAEPESSLPGPVAVYVPTRANRSGASAGSRSVARTVEGLTAIDAGPDAGRLFIRGVADTPFSGYGQSPVSVEIDEARATFDAPDPDLRLVDVARVELLKGPQGPLYGTGALGGVYRVVLNAPNPAAPAARFRYDLGAVEAGGPGTSAEAMLNLPVANGQGAVRAVAYGELASGWIRNVGGRAALNQTRTWGARLAGRLDLGEWRVSLTGLTQSVAARDSRYIDRLGEDLVRTPRLREPRQGDIHQAAATVTGPLGAATLTFASSFTAQHIARTDDASASAALLGAAAPLAYHEERDYALVDQELRIASTADRRLSWIVGLSYLHSTITVAGALRPPNGATLDVLDLHRNVSEVAAYGEATLRLAPRLRAAIGARIFHSAAEDGRAENAGKAINANSNANGASTFGITPSASLSLATSGGGLVYARVATAFRPGGLDPANTVTHRYDADQLSNIDIGVRGTALRGSLTLDFGAYRTRWLHVQSDYLLPSGLLATHNVGDALIMGMEGSLAWHAGGGWTLSGGGTLQRARLTRAEDGTKLLTDLRLPVVPDVAGRLALAWQHDWHGWSIEPSIAARYGGPSRLSFDPGLDRRMGGFGEADVALAATRGRMRATLSIDNLFDARGDSFAFGNPFSVRTETQYTPTRPRSATLSFAVDF
ncbi:TonB-dependent receptor [Sphingomonas sp. AR_OL41]|uniref:TonB-dependent receptor n=1 Tax=Sphingomonas sp. AR_OL41 TaxID=3042729 RepID=UPI002480E6AC|nr:TonB-dependent receptor [Sphingomonas sp. AR_OL41]MDH7975628.1 TonB-dependent receptor [Sphingomonas sp. AR_OL41]